MCDEGEGQWALVRTLQDMMCKGPAEKEVPKKEGKQEERQRRDDSRIKERLGFKERGRDSLCDL